MCLDSWPMDGPEGKATTLVDDLESGNDKEKKRLQAIEEFAAIDVLKAWF